ncbi:MAG: DNA mismatch repair endonuclease MutL [Streptococcaceae bacterium]|jgi:DNA mismatch repair protein MutL|nr:DNA mismatch repair endonuclease MutL [Streptococcaceae bacterium]
MGHIQELTTALANKIAAGEVVERPASVVKELVENAIDAGASEIAVRLEESGMREIQVVDNGEGIRKDEIRLAFKRHATSKIRDVNDLFRIQTLGFRGEALPSIASVSELEILSANEEDEEGSRLVLKGGEEVVFEPAPLRKGTKITVKNLFFNTPARLKYVRSLPTELSKITDILNRIALSHPEISFSLTHEGQNLISTHGNGSLKVAIAGVYGHQTASKMVEITGEDFDYKVHGFVSLPEDTRSNRNYISLIINGRYVKNYLLNKAIASGYGSKLMGGRFPIAVLHIELDPLLIDVNVHPTKQEVRLSNERELMGLITRLIQVAFQKKVLIPEVSNTGRRNETTRKEVEQLSLEDSMIETPSLFEKKNKPIASSPGEDVGFDVEKGVFYIKENAPLKEGNPIRSELREKPLSDSEERLSAEITESSSTVDSELAEYTPDRDTELADCENELKNHPDFDFANRQRSKVEIEKIWENLQKEEEVSAFPTLDYFGQMHGTYLFASTRQGLYVVDQHAAQERIKYEYYREEIGNVGNNMQDLLIPIIFEYSLSDRIRILENRELLATVGVEIEEYGQHHLIVRTHPTWIRQGKEENVLRELMDMFLATGQVSVKKFREETAIMMSCKRSIKANHHLSELQARQLLKDLEKCKNPYNCPHGRPVLIHFSNYEMERFFKRIQDPHENFK